MVERGKVVKVKSMAYHVVTYIHWISDLYELLRTNAMGNYKKLFLKKSEIPTSVRSVFFTIYIYVSSAVVVEVKIPDLFLVKISQIIVCLAFFVMIRGFIYFTIKVTFL